MLSWPAGWCYSTCPGEVITDVVAQGFKAADPLHVSLARCQRPVTSLLLPRVIAIMSLVSSVRGCCCQTTSPDLTRLSCMQFVHPQRSDQRLWCHQRISIQCWPCARRWKLCRVWGWGHILVGCQCSSSHCLRLDFQIWQMAVCQQGNLNSQTQDVRFRPRLYSLFASLWGRTVLKAEL